jgi:DNA gyrase/topoisomerase IV subunit A
MDVDKIAQLLTGAVSLIAIIITLITASTAAKTSALAALNIVVDTLKKEVEEQQKTISQLRRELEKERRIRRGYEEYIQTCILKFNEERIVPPVPPVFFNQDAEDYVG